MSRSLSEEAAVVDVFSTMFEEVSEMNIVFMGCAARPYAAQFRHCFFTFDTRRLYLVNSRPVTYRSASTY